MITFLRVQAAWNKGSGPDTLLKELKTDGNSFSFVLLATALTSEGQKNERIKQKRTKERKKRRKKKKR